MRTGLALVSMAAFVALLPSGCGDSGGAPIQRQPAPERAKAKPQAAAAPVAEPANAEPETTYWTGVVIANGLPKGVTHLMPLNAVRQRHVEVTVLDEKNREVRLLDARNHVETRWAVQQLGEDWFQVEVSDGQGRLQETWTVTESGRTLERRGPDGRWVDAHCARYKRVLNDQGQAIAERCQGHDGSNREDADGIFERRYEVNATGFVTSERGYDTYERPVALEAGRPGTDPALAVYVRRYERNMTGQPVEQTNWDIRGQPTDDAVGIHRRARSFSEAGDPTHLVTYAASGKRTGGATGVAETRWVYDDGRLAEVGYLDSNGKHTRNAIGIGRIVYKTDASGRVLREDFADEEGRPLVRADLGVAAIDNAYDEETGRHRVMRFLGSDGAPVVALGRGYAGLEWTYDEDGRVVEERRLGRDGEPIATEVGGWATRAFKRDLTGQLAEERYEDGYGDLVIGPDGWAVRQTTEQVAVETGAGTEVVIETLDTERKLTRARGAPYARVIERRDERGRVMERSYFDAHRDATVEPEGRVHKAMYEYNEAGDLSRVSYEGPDGLEAVHAQIGASQERITHDKFGRELKRERFDGQDQHVQGAGGWAIRERQYDELGRLTETRWLEGHEVSVGRSSDGLSREHRFYGIGNTLRQKAFYTANGDALHMSPGGYARESFELDAFDRVVAIETFDRAERPVIRDDLGYARAVRTLDELGRITEERYQDNTRGDVIVPKLGYAGIRRLFDEQGRVVKEIFLDPEGEPTFTPKGYAQRVLGYAGDTWTVKTETFLGPRGRPAFHQDGYSALERAVDAEGRTTRIKYLDTLGNPAVDKYGAAERTWTWAGPLLISLRTLGPSGEAVTAHNGTAGFDREYDPYGRMVKETAVDSGGLPTYDRETGCASTRWERDSVGDVVRTVCADATGQPMTGNAGWAVKEEQRDLHGWVTSVTLRDGANELVVGPQGWATRITLYDRRGWVVGEAFVGKDGTPTTLKGGYAGLQIERDGRGRVVRETHLDAVGEAVTRGSGWVARALRYDAHGRVIEESWVDAAGKPSRGGAPAILRRTYDTTGKLVETRHLDASGRATAGPDGWSTEILEHDERGRLIRRRFLDASGNAGNPRDGIAAVRYIIDRFGRVRETTYLDRALRPTNTRGPGDRAWAIDKSEFDRFGHKAEQSWFDAEGRPTLGPEGVHRIVWTWNERAQVVAQQRFTAPARPAPGGWARQTHTYDRFGRLAGIRYQDQMGRPSGVWNGVGRVHLTYDDGGRLRSMRYLDGSGKPKNAKVCYPGRYCGSAPVHEAVYVYEHDDTPVRMRLMDAQGRSSGTVQCSTGKCW